MTSLREWDDRIGRIIFQIKGVRSSVVLVEGPTDVFVLEGLVGRKFLVNAAGRSNVFALGEGLHQQGESRFVAVFDRDFSTDNFDASPHLHPYDQNDLESMLAEMGLLGDLLTVNGQSEKLKLRGGVDAVIGVLRECVAPVSELRKASHLGGWGLNFDDCDFGKFVNQKTLKLDLDRYCAALYNLRLKSGSLDTPPSLAEIKQVVAVTPSPDGPYRGKDLVTAASVALRQYVGNLSKAQAEAERLVGSLHFAGKHAMPTSQWGGSLRARMESQAA